MRTRAARLWLAAAVIATAAMGGLAAAHPGSRALARDVARPAAATAHAAAEAGLPGLPGVGSALLRAAAADAALAPAALLPLAFLLLVIPSRRHERRLARSVASVSTRGPPPSR